MRAMVAGKPAAAASAIIFAAAHSYQGAKGILRTGFLGALLTLVLAMSGSLWPGIVLHALMDICAGIIAWLVLREPAAESSAT